MHTCYPLCFPALSRKADIEAQDVDSYTPLLTAVSYGNTRAMEVLLERKATMDVIDRDGKSIVFIAAEENHEDILEVSPIHPTSSFQTHY